MPIVKRAAEPDLHFSADDCTGPRRAPITHGTLPRCTTEFRVMRVSRFGVVVVAMLCAAGAQPAQAQAPGFPSKVVRIVVQTTAGGSIDLTARLVGQRLTEFWGQNVIIDNRAGAGSVIGADVVAKSAPDGYTVGFIASMFTVSASVYRKLPYDSINDFVPVTQLASSAWALAVNASLPVHSVKEFVALAKKNPGQINYASTGSGGATHLAFELLKSMTGTRIVHIPYKGTAPAVNDLVGGQVEAIITGLPALMPHVTTRRLRLLGMAGSSRSAVLPDLPTIGETIAGYEYNNWFGAVAPKGTPNEIVASLRDGIVRALQTNEVKRALLAQSIEPLGTTPAQFGELMRSEISKYTKLSKAIGVSVD